MKQTQSLARRVRYFPLTTKQASWSYYKGNRTGSMGTHTKFGGYEIDYNKVRSYVCPDLSGFNLTPFVARKVNPFEDKIRGRPRDREIGAKHPQSGVRYLRQWKEENGED